MWGSPHESAELRKVTALLWGECSFVLNHLLGGITRLRADSGGVRALFRELTQVARLNKCWKEFGAFSWVTVVSSGGIVNLALEGDYRVLLFLSFVEIKVCVCTCVGLPVITPIRFHHLHCLQESCLPLCTKGDSQSVLGSSLSHECVPCLSPGSWWERHWIWPSPLTAPLLEEVEMLKGGGQPEGGWGSGGKTETRLRERI